MRNIWLLVLLIMSHTKPQWLTCSFRLGCPQSVPLPRLKGRCPWYVLPWFHISLSLESQVSSKSTRIIEKGTEWDSFDELLTFKYDTCQSLTRSSLKAELRGWSLKFEGWFCLFSVDQKVIYTRLGTNKQRRKVKSRPVFGPGFSNCESGLAADLSARILLGATRIRWHYVPCMALSPLPPLEPSHHLGWLGPLQSLVPWL